MSLFSFSKLVIKLLYFFFYSFNLWNWFLHKCFHLLSLVLNSCHVLLPVNLENCFKKYYFLVFVILSELLMQFIPLNLISGILGNSFINFNCCFVQQRNYKGKADKYFNSFFLSVLIHIVSEVHNAGKPEILQSYVKVSMVNFLCVWIIFFFCIFAWQL